MIEVYKVRWHVQGEDSTRESRCHVEEGYSTTDDFPKMLAIGYLGSSDKAGQIVIEDFKKVSVR